MALPEPSSKEGQNNKSSDQDDKDFDPTAEALIDEIDDERTLEEEEALGTTGTAVQEELDDLKRESDMPIEELLAYYERMRNETQNEQASDEEEQEVDGGADHDDEEEEEEEGEEEEEEGENEENEEKTDTVVTKSDSPAHSTKPSTHSSDVVQQQHHLKGNNPEISQSSGCKSSIPQTTHTTNHRYPPNCGIMDSDAHSTTITPVETTTSALDEIHQHRKQQQFSTLNQQEATQSNNITDSSSTDTVHGRPKHPMTDFIIDEENGGMFKTLFGYDLDDSDDMDEDYSYTDDENGDDERDWRRTIHIGPGFQADVPEELSEYDDLPPYENEDKLIWKWNTDLTQENVIDYFKQASSLSKRNDISISPASVPKISNDTMRIYRERMQDITSSTGSHAVEQNYEAFSLDYPPRNLLDAYISQSRKRARIDYELEQENAMDISTHTQGAQQNLLTNSNREENSDSTSQDLRAEPSTDEYYQDEEQLLFLLLQCNHSIEEALRRRKLDPFKYYFNEPMSLWSQEECLAFEHGLRVYGKNFRLIRENKVQTRTHAEVVAFYYLWKKSERHDVYTNQYKLDRKRCLSHPGTTDYMDKFIEDNESTLNASSSSTPTPSDSLVTHPRVDSTNDNNSATPLLMSHAYQACKIITDKNSPLQLESTPVSSELDMNSSNKDE